MVNGYGAAIATRPEAGRRFHFRQQRPINCPSSIWQNHSLVLLLLLLLLLLLYHWFRAFFRFVNVCDFVKVFLCGRLMFDSLTNLYSSFIYLILLLFFITAK